ncbi:hypothetical protein [Sphingobium sp. D43FB]|uniref:hypothetical protein n=1 Tax=Sphingobium sp. D43FB TaxID=2017595 RepID=UPI001596E83F|nr:hypothetical protein [Sphingobium sp. D43FB]
MSEPDPFRPTIVTDYLLAIFDKALKDYLAEFKAGLLAFASTFNVTDRLRPPALL